ncbi:MAG: response regulator [Candidatus Omnitrophica bacterium]|nr:response regulator [Candidatus Omnitrophota bacterium]
MLKSIRRILLVEDNLKDAGTVRQFLESQGYQVTLAVDGREALTKARELSPHLILLDALLPKLSGFQVTRLLKFSEKTKGIPIVMLTILDRPEDQEKGRKVGVDFYLTKPFSEEALCNLLRRLLP